VATLPRPQNGAVTYREVDDVVADGSEGDLCVHGRVRPGTLAVRGAPGAPTYRFVIARGGLGMRIDADGVPGEAMSDDAPIFACGEVTRAGGEATMHARTVVPRMMWDEPEP
jgi:hypothetical protein